ncbi:cytoskeleton-associated protein 2-like [Dryobates pubescens]|uniref:cytoskeleton-associated protein 2-like n=1 Tax=Dryobates pubescens TaxID=118200 RepID=UPI0023B93BE2|nr:cytoskeleton-associated protein 2-like [Dryobates pubescens]
MQGKPCVKDQMNPPLKPLPRRPGQVDRNKKDVGRPVPKGAPRDGKLGAKPTQHTGHAAQQKPSAASQRAAGLHPVQPRKGTKLPVVPGVSRSVQPRGKLPASSHLNPGRSKNPAQDTAAPPAESDQPHPGAPCCPNGDLQNRLGSNKENIQAQAPAQPVLNRALQAARDRQALTPRQSSAITSRATTGPRDRVSSHQAKEKLAPEKFRPTVLASKNPSTKTQPLQPPWQPAASTRFLHKRSGATQEKTGTARPLHVKRSPTKPLTSSRPQGATKLQSSLKPDGTVRQQKPLAKGEADRKEVKVAPPGHTAVSRAPPPRKQPCSTQSSRAPPVESDWRRGRVDPELPKAGGVFPRRVPKTLTPADRKKQLQEWLASKGKTYKRPPMILLQKNPVKLSCRNIKEKEKQEKPELPSLEKTNNLLTECLKLVEEGAQAEEVLAMLSAMPQAERFAKFWICRAKLQARSGPFDVAGLYRAAVCAGATPLQELREVVLEMLKAADRTSEGEKAELPIPGEPATPGPGGRQPRAVTPCPAGRSLTCLPVSVKLQVTSAPRGRELPEGPELKFLTPVRRSLRIERAGRRYPEMLKDHDPVVSSLREILDPEEETRWFFRRNEALPEVVEPEGIALCPPECC